MTASFREKILARPLFRYGNETLAHLTFKWFTDELDARWGTEAGPQAVPKVLGLKKTDKVQAVWCYYLAEHFNPELDCNVRGFIIPDFDGMTASLGTIGPQCTAVLDALRSGTWARARLSVDAAQLERQMIVVRELCERRAPAKGKIFDIDNYILLALFHEMSGKKDWRYCALAEAFRELVPTVRNPAVRMKEKIADAEKAIFSVGRRRKS